MTVPLSPLLRPAPWSDAATSERPGGPVPVGHLRTTANLVTTARTVVSVVIALVGIATGRPLLLVIAYGVYWIGDMADGWLARRLDQETRLGAVLDIVCDRACTAVLAAGLVAHAPGTAPVVVVFLLSFLVVDTMLSLSFLCWPIRSPNDFARIDRQVYGLNWSPLAKALNTAGVVGALALGAELVALLVALLVVGVKIWSSCRVLSLLAGPEQGRSATAARRT